MLNWNERFIRVCLGAMVILISITALAIMGDIVARGFRW